jgi:hypothetical protein
LEGRRDRGLYERVDTIDGKPVRRVLPGFMVTLFRKEGYHRIGGPLVASPPKARPAFRRVVPPARNS